MNIDFTNYLASEKIFAKASELADRLDVKIYLVGGYVRDLILKRNNKDIDILVVGDGPSFARKISELLGIENITIFKNFGTAYFSYEGYEFEFVGARKESYSRESRKPVVTDGSFEDDISRRDFTINTIALSLNKSNFGELIDLYDGLKHIESKLIKTPLNAGVTFNDDPLRIMRAFRFAAQLDFKIDDETLTAAREMRERLKIVSQERISDEFLKILSSPKPSIGLRYLYDTEVLAVIFPEIYNLGGVDQRKDFHHKDVFLHTCQVVDNIAVETDDVWLRFAALVHDIAKPHTKRFVEGTGWTFHGHEEIGARMMKEIFKRMKFPLSKLNYVEKLVRLHLRPIALVDESVTDSAIRRLIVSADDALDDLITLCRADITSKNLSKVTRYLSNYEKVMQKVKDVREKDKLRAFQSPVRGEEIMQVCNLRPSKKVGEIKSAIEEAILEGEIENTYEAAYKYLLKIKDKLI